MSASSIASWHRRVCIADLFRVVSRLRRSAHYLLNLNCAQKMDPSLSFTIN